MVEQKLPKLTTRVRFPSPAPITSKTYLRSLFHIISAKTADFRKKSFCGWDDACAPEVVALRSLDALVAQELACRLLTALFHIKTIFNSEIAD
jgi:hypothetical protein